MTPEHKAKLQAARILAIELGVERAPQKTPMERHQDDPLSKSKAIVAKCYECIYDPGSTGSWRDQVRKCTSVSCPLYTVRPQ